MNKASFVFLGGTCGKNNWRTAFIEKLVALGYKQEQLFNPVVEDWNDDARMREEEAKADATHRIFYLADPKDGKPSILSCFEATMALYDHTDTTIVVFDLEGFEGHIRKAFIQAMHLLKERHPDAHIFASPDEAIEWLNKNGVKAS